MAAAAADGASVAPAAPSGTTFQVSVPLAAATTAVSFNTNAPVTAAGQPDPFNVGLSSGSLTARLPIDLPAGPGGLTPPLALIYNSASVSEQHNPQAAGPWVGEGWNLSLGSISWSEHNVTAGNPTATWQDSWKLNDPFGASRDLIGANLFVKTYYDDTPNPITPSPMTWHTAPETHARVVSYQGPNALPGMADVPPCFRVFLPNGVMEEFGCTPDSVQYYPQINAGVAKYYIANWLLDLITDPQGNQIHVTYQRDLAIGPGGLSYPRDVVLQTVEWDSPNCRNAQAACTGIAWGPLMRANFVSTHAVARQTGAACPPNGSLRCDDPVDLPSPGGLGAPIVQSTFVLNDVQVQAWSAPTAAWNTLRTYQLSYEQSPPTTITDPATGLQQSTAGKLNLTKFQEVGDDGTTTRPARTFSYTSQTEYSEDGLFVPTPSTNCGPPWNTYLGTGCQLWSQSYASNSSYLSTAST